MGSDERAAKVAKMDDDTSVIVQLVSPEGDKIGMFVLRSQVHAEGCGNRAGDAL